MSNQNNSIDMCKEYNNKLTLSPILICLISELRGRDNAGTLINKISSLLDNRQTGSVELNFHDTTIIMKLSLIVVKKPYTPEVFLPDTTYINELYQQMWCLKIAAVSAWDEFISNHADILSESTQILGYDIRKLQLEHSNLGLVYFDKSSVYGLSVNVNYLLYGSL